MTLPAVAINHCCHGSSQTNISWVLQMHIISSFLAHLAHCYLHFVNDFYDAISATQQSNLIWSQ